jgi:hypothetical protein
MTVSGLESSAVGACRNGVPDFGGTANVARIYTGADSKLPDEGAPATRSRCRRRDVVINEKIHTRSR